jgi:hypothetical protein
MGGSAGRVRCAPSQPKRGGLQQAGVDRRQFEFRGPIGVADIEARVDLLAERKLLLSDPDGVMMTTRGAIWLEREVLSWARRA